MQRKEISIKELEDLSEAELEALIMDKNNSNNDARYVLGRLMIDGSSEKVAHNETKGLNWLKEASKKGSWEAIEYKTYWDIRFDKAPNLQKVMDQLNKIIDNTKAPRACNTMAEICHSQGSTGMTNEKEEIKREAELKAAEAAKYYQMSAEQGDIPGKHWIGVFYHEGFGVSKNISKAMEYLTEAATAGNCQSMYQLFLIQSGREGQDPKYKNVAEAYKWLIRGTQNGATFFDDANAFFKEHYDALAPAFVDLKKLGLTVEEKNKADIMNMHNATVNEAKNDFSACLGKDRLYHKPCGFLNDQQIWMLGVQIQYLLNSVLRFDHKDFLKAVKVDLGPVLGHTGLWALRQQLANAKESGDNELKKKVNVATELVEKYLENGLEVLG